MCWLPVAWAQHVRTAGGRAVLRDGAVKQVDVLKERYGCKKDKIDKKKKYEEKG